VSGPAVRAVGVVKEYELGRVTVQALRGVDLELPRGAFVVLLGPSGSGKTTLLNLVGGLDQPTRGELVVMDQALGALSDEELTSYRRDNIGFVFQLFNLVPTLTALENVALIGELVGDAGRAEQILCDVGLGDRLHQLPAQLSGGEQQRVAIARALIKQPPLLLADEPTGALDSETGRSVMQLLWEETRRRQVTVMMVTHNEEFQAIGDVIVHLKSGHVVEVHDQPQARSPQELLP